MPECETYYIGVDPALGKAKGDYFALTLLGRLENKFYATSQGYKIKPDEMIKKIINKKGPEFSGPYCFYFFAAFRLRRISSLNSLNTPFGLTSSSSPVIFSTCVSVRFELPLRMFCLLRLFPAETHLP